MCWLTGISTTHPARRDIIPAHLPAEGGYGHGYGCNVGLTGLAGEGMHMYKYVGCGMRDVGGAWWQTALIGCRWLRVRMGAGLLWPRAGDLGWGRWDGGLACLVFCVFFFCFGSW